MLKIKTVMKTTNRMMKINKQPSYSKNKQEVEVEFKEKSNKRK